MQNTTDWLKETQTAKQTAKALGMPLWQFLKHLSDEEAKEQSQLLANAERMRPVYRKMIMSGIDIKHLVQDDPLLLQTYLSEKRKWQHTNSSRESSSQKKSQAKTANT